MEWDGLASASLRPTIAIWLTETRCLSAWPPFRAGDGTRIFLAQAHLKDLKAIWLLRAFFRCWIRLRSWDAPSPSPKIRIIKTSVKPLSATQPGNVILELIPEFSAARLSSMAAKQQSLALCRQNLTSLPGRRSGPRYL